MRDDEESCYYCQGRGAIETSTRVGSGDWQQWVPHNETCGICGGSGTVRKPRTDLKPLAKIVLDTSTEFGARMVTHSQDLWDALPDSATRMENVARVAKLYSQAKASGDPALIAVWKKQWDRAYWQYTDPFRTKAKRHPATGQILEEAHA